MPRFNWRFAQRRPLALATAAMIAIAVGCTSGDSNPVAVTTVPATSSTSTTTSSTTTTTTLPYTHVTVAADAEEEITAVLGQLYTWLTDRDAPVPDLPIALAEHLADSFEPTTELLEAEVFTDGVLGMGQAGVAIVEDGDVVLLVNDLDRTGEVLTGWRIVGGWFQRHDLDPWFGEAIRRVLIIGTDAREWQDPVRFRGDSLHIVSSNIESGGGGILGFPRDSWIEAPYGTDKFTHVNALTWTASDQQVEDDLELIETDPYLSHAARWLDLDTVIEMIRIGPLGGEVTVDVAEELTGLPIEGYILTGFRDFQLLFNNYGSVTVDIPFAMADRASGAFFKAGVQELWGKAALAFSRNRHIGGGDFTRSFHQGLVIVARLQGVLESDFTQLPYLISALKAHTWTDLSLEDLMTLGAGAYLLDPDKVGNAVAPGSVATRSGRSVVLLADSAEELYRDMDDGVLDLPEE